MNPDLRRIVAVAAHFDRTRKCPTFIHSLGTGESAEIRPSQQGFVDLASGRKVELRSSELIVSGMPQPIALALDADVEFSGFDPASGESFSGRCGGGTSVTIYEQSSEFFQYAVTTPKG